jgi:uncharacterized Zn finger protein
MDLETYCPVCREEQGHVIVASSRDLVVRCEICGNVKRIPLPEEEKQISVKAIVSSEESSRVCRVELPPKESCAIGDRLVVECGDEYVGVEVTAIERDQKRVKRAIASEILTLWTRKIEEVVVRVSLHDGRTTSPLFLPVTGEEPFEVGGVYRHAGRQFRIVQIKLRNGAVMRKEGWKTVARRIKRIYAVPSP